MTATAFRAVADRVTGPDGVLWDLSGLTETGDMVYTEGDCWALAWHVFKLLQNEPAFADVELHTLGRKDTWCHVVVKIGEDSYLDVNGVHTAREVQSAWFGNKLYPVPTAFTSTVGKYQAYLDTDFNFKSGHSEANRIADLVLEQYVY